MRSSILVAALLLFGTHTDAVFAQKTTTVVVDPSRPRHVISDRVYGSNGQDDLPQARVTSRRLGGNRLTTYNWENNASNAGQDWFHQSDNYLTWINGIAPVDEDVPAIFVKVFLDSSARQGVPSILTLPMAGYVARDKGGEVPESQAAPSPRWARVELAHPGAFPLAPDTTDDVVYVDEFIHAVRRLADSSARPMPPIGFALDNEPEIWYSTHPRVHAAKLSCAEMFQRSIALAGTVKRMWPEVEVFGPEHYGFNAMLSLQDAPDWIDYRDRYPRFVDAYLDRMRLAADSAGKRLLDVLSVHWYPDVAGVFTGDVGRTAVRHRVQLPRSLWDSTYVEDSWIGQWFSPVALLPSLQSSIDTYYPGTKLAVGEWAYGAADHVSGGLAAVDVLGIMGAHDVYAAHHWGTVTGYVAAAFMLWRNYDVLGASAGSTSIPSHIAHVEDGAVHATMDAASGAVHVLLVNRNLDSSLTVDLTIAGAVAHTMDVWRYFDQSGPVLRSMSPVAADPGTQTWHVTLPPLSAHHVVFTKSVVGVETMPVAVRSDLSLAPNPAIDRVSCRYLLAPGATGEIVVHDMLGRMVRRAQGLAGGGILELNLAGLPAGSYRLTLTSGTTMLGRMLHVVR